VMKASDAISVPISNDRSGQYVLSA
jgi:hypothetical protein